MKIFIPFQVVRRENCYLLWVVGVAFFGLINVWGGMLLKGTSAFVEAITGGTGYVFAISICVPQFTDILIKFIVDKRSKRDTYFVKCKIISIFSSILLAILASFLWSGIYKGNVFWQVVFSFFAIFISFYSYAVVQMEHHPDFLKEHDDDEYNYLDIENEEKNDLGKKSKNMNEFESKNGNRIEL